MQSRDFWHRYHILKEIFRYVEYTAGKLLLEIPSTILFRWDSSVGPFIFEDQFIQISTQPPSSFVYGFGEQEHQSFKHNLSAWEVLPIFTRDQFPFVSSFLNLKLHWHISEIKTAWTLLLNFVSKRPLAEWRKFVWASSFLHLYGERRQISWSFSHEQ